MYSLPIALFFWEMEMMNQPETEASVCLGKLADNILFPVCNASKKLWESIMQEETEHEGKNGQNSLWFNIELPWRMI